jgi:predicted RNA-binding Zn-ribbon protein involved in translation (DUF1610 family)
MIDKLKMIEKLQLKPALVAADLSGVTNISLNQPLRNCQSIQQQLDKLKELMESVCGNFSDLIILSCSTFRNHFTSYNCFFL